MVVEQNVVAALSFADRVYILNNGHMVYEGTPDELRADPENHEEPSWGVGFPTVPLAAERRTATQWFRTCQLPAKGQDALQRTWQFIRNPTGASSRDAGASWQRWLGCVLRSA